MRSSLEKELALETVWMIVNRVPAHNEGYRVTQRKTHNSHSHACTLHEIEKAYNNGQEVPMLENPNIVAGTDVDTHTYPLSLTNLDS